ncbi:hypothetical protein LXL04_029001 [Taraxacum kok-saghyz]
MNLDEGNFVLSLNITIASLSFLKYFTFTTTISPVTSLLASRCPSSPPPGRKLLFTGGIPQKLGKNGKLGILDLTSCLAQFRNCWVNVELQENLLSGAFLVTDFVSSNLGQDAIGFGKDAIGGRNGRIYVVTDPHNDNPVNPVPGTLRYGVIQDEPLWIIFKRDMVIQLRQELVMNSFKTIDGRGVNVHIGNGPCITIHDATNIIIHGIHIHDCEQAGNGYIRNSPHHSGWWRQSDGDGITVDLLIKICNCNIK